MRAKLRRHLVCRRWECIDCLKFFADTVGAIGATGVTFISSGALTHSVKAFDISLLIDQDNYREC